MTYSTKPTILSTTPSAIEDHLKTNPLPAFSAEQKAKAWNSKKLKRNLHSQPSNQKTMKRLFQITCLLGLIIITITTCEKWDLNKTNFVLVSTGTDYTTTNTTATVEGKISGLTNGKIIDHGHIYSCVQTQPEIGQSDVESSLLGITFEEGTFPNTLEDLTLFWTSSI